MPYQIRGHTLLCLQGFRGEGYSPAFVANMTKIHAALLGNPDQLVTPIASPDEICASCPHLNGGCTLRGPQSEGEMIAQDRVVLQRLGLVENQAVTWRHVLQRISATTAGKDLSTICGACPWLPLGYCAEGIDRLKRA